MTQKLCCGKWTKKKAFVVVVSFIFGVGGILNVFKIFRSVTTSSVISSGYMGYKAKEKVVRLGNDIMSLSKTISKLSKQKKINEIGEIRRKREENFKSKGALNANFEDEYSRADFDSWKLGWAIQDCSRNAPKQHNTTDCGVFTLLSIYLASRGIAL